MTTCPSCFFSVSAVANVTSTSLTTDGNGDIWTVEFVCPECLAQVETTTDSYEYLAATIVLRNRADVEQVRYDEVFAKIVADL